MPGQLGPIGTTQPRVSKLQRGISRSIGDRELVDRARATREKYVLDAARGCDRHPPDPALDLASGGLCRRVELLAALD